MTDGLFSLMHLLPETVDPAANEVTVWTLQTPLTESTVLVALAVLVTALVLSYRALAKVPTRLRTVLLSLRTLTAAALLLLLLGPARQDMTTIREANDVVVLVDTSASMAQALDRGSETRFDLAKAVAKEMVAELQDNPRFSPRVMTFAEEAVATDLQRLLANEDPIAADGSGSRLSNALEAALDSSTSLPVGGIVLLSDGATTDETVLEERVANRLQQENVPVFALNLAGKTAFKDIAIEDVQADAFAFVRNPLKLTARIRHSGFAGRKLNVRVDEDGQPALEKAITLGSEPPSQAFGITEVELSFEPKSAGEHVYTVSVPPQEEESIRENNRFGRSIKVIRDRIRVLLVAGRPSWDELFIRRLLKDNPSVDLISFFILRSPTDEVTASSDELSLIPFPTRELFTEELHTFDVVIMHNFNYRPYQMGMYLENIRDFVKDAGGGLLMVGGDLAFSEGEYQGTPVADVLPVRLLPGQGHLDKRPFRPIWSESGQSHPITDLGASMSRGRLPELEGVNLVAGLAPDAVALWTHPFINAEGGAHPVLAAREVGEGRSVALLTDTAWHWSLPHVGQGGRGDVHHRLFANILRWLIRDPELSRVRVRAETARAEIAKPAVVVVEAFTEGYQALPNAEVRVTFLPLEGQKVTEVNAQGGVTDASGRARIRFTPDVSGAWRVNAEARDDGQLVGRSETVLIVGDSSREAKNLLPRPDHLQVIAERTQGALFSSSETDLAFTDHQRERVLEQRTRPAWPTPGVLVLLVLLVCSEWYLRRRHGLS